MTALVTRADSRPWMVRNASLASVALALAVVGLGTEPAAGARPVGGARYYGFEENGAPSWHLHIQSAALGISRDARRFAARRGGSYLDVSGHCNGARKRVVHGTINLASTRRQVRIGSTGRFRAAGRSGRLRYRLRGRFSGADEARIVYRASRPPPGGGGACKVARHRVSLFRNGQPPFRGCRREPAKTLVLGVQGRVFEQGAFDRSISRRTASRSGRPSTRACSTAVAVIGLVRRRSKGAR